ncbi:CPBP family intramembrane glutamic endopeptidase [Klebsiella aerogenes]|nr:CPBP family intramembrane metalloprotease [Klebsiella aerogenes]
MSTNTKVKTCSHKNTLILGFVFILSVLITFVPILIYQKLQDANLSFKIMVVLEFGVSFIVYVIFYRKSFNSIKNRADIFFISLAVLVGIQFLTYVLQNHDIGSIKITSDNALSLFMLAIIIPFYEEVFYRGCLFDVLVSMFKGELLFPSIITSIIFSLMHTQYSGIMAFLIMFFISLILIKSRVVSKNIISPVLLHCIMNAFFIFINVQNFF